MCLQWVSASTVTLLSHFLFIYLSTTHIETLYSIQVLKVRLFSCWSLSFLFLSPMTAFNKKCSYWQFKSLCNTGDITSFPEVCEYSLMGKDFRLRDFLFSLYEESGVWRQLTLWHYSVKNRKKGARETSYYKVIKNDVEVITLPVLRLSTGPQWLEQCSIAINQCNQVDCYEKMER